MNKTIAVSLFLFIGLLVGCTSAAQPVLPAETLTLPAAVATPVATLPALQAGAQEISGVVLSGGDQTPPDLQDAPRQFVYQVQMEDGKVVNVAYTAYPPSPAADRRKITLDFHAGQVQVGDYMEAKGQFDPVTNTLTVSEEGDSIRTYSQKP